MNGAVPSLLCDPPRDPARRRGRNGSSSNGPRIAIPIPKTVIPVPAFFLFFGLTAFFATFGVLPPNPYSASSARGQDRPGEGPTARGKWSCTRCCLHSSVACEPQGGKAVHTESRGIVLSFVIVRNRSLLGKLFITHTDCRSDPIDRKGDDIPSPRATFRIISYLIRTSVIDRFHFSVHHRFPVSMYLMKPP